MLSTSDGANSRVELHSIISTHQDLTTSANHPLSNEPHTSPATEIGPDAGYNRSLTPISTYTQRCDNFPADSDTIETLGVPNRDAGLETETVSMPATTPLVI
jgi:hypothetical protein